MSYRGTRGGGKAVVKTGMTRLSVVLWSAPSLWRYLGEVRSNEIHKGSGLELGMEKKKEKKRDKRTGRKRVHR